MRLQLVGKYFGGTSAAFRAQWLEEQRGVKGHPVRGGGQSCCRLKAALLGPQFQSHPRLFTDVSAGSGLDVAGYGDIRLLLNNGTFSDITKEAGLGDSHWATSTAFSGRPVGGGGRTARKQRQRSRQACRERLRPLIIWPFSTQVTRCKPQALGEGTVWEYAPAKQKKRPGKNPGLLQFPLCRQPGQPMAKPFGRTWRP